MWLKVVNFSSGAFLVNLDKVHHLAIFYARDCSVVTGYLEDGGYRNDGDGDYNSLDLFEGTQQECNDYLEWIYEEMNARNDIVEYNPKEREKENVDKCEKIT